MTDWIDSYIGNMKSNVKVCSNVKVYYYSRKVSWLYQEFVIKEGPLLCYELLVTL